MLNGIKKAREHINNNTRLNYFNSIQAQMKYINFPCFVKYISEK